MVLLGNGRPVSGSLTAAVNTPLRSAAVGTEPTPAVEKWRLKPSYELNAKNRLRKIGKPNVAPP